eukprot:m.39359 g.39359  ORF g.39359 m.39359 type:complete len:346 (+) comp12669_c0_seq1:147-1184(+)
MAVVQDSSQNMSIQDDVSKSVKRNIEDCLMDWSFSALEWSQDELITFAVCILERQQTRHTLGVTKEHLRNFVAEVGRNYNGMHFHNLPHAIMVLHSTFLLRATVSLPFNSPLDEVALLIAALCHDLDHRALSNTFYTNSKSELAEKYGDKSVLEHHHANTAFSIISNETVGILNQLDTAQKERFREVVFQCILATDMAVHKDRLDFLEGLKVKLDDKSHSGVYNDEEYLLLMQCILHTADLYNPFKPFKVAQQWALRLQKEFNEQVEKEKELGLPFLPFMAGSGPEALAKGEVGFITFVARPWYHTMSEVFAEVKVLVTILDNNIKLWKAEHEALQAAAEAAPKE